MIERTRIVSNGLWMALWAVLATASCSTSPAPAADQAAEPAARQTAEPGAKPFINTRWRSTEIEPLIESLESESREIYLNRALLADVVGPRPGSDVADIGTGSGFMAREFTRLVGETGTVFAVDINPAMMQHVALQAAADGIENLRTVVCTDESVNLAAGSVDTVFICDTYHHVEQPASTMRSIHEAMRPGGVLVVVDFRREPGRSRAWILEHVRAGKEVFIEEITAAGFEFVEEHEVPELRENYVLRFRRVP